MRNGVANLFKSEERRGFARRVGERPALRLCLLFACVLLPLMVTITRLAYVQLSLTETYLHELERTTDRYEEMPTIVGRILSADGEVLAQDEELYQLSVHYRWLENPPNPTWLKQSARSKLTRKGRRDKTLVAAETSKLTEFREGLWLRLSELTREPAESIGKKRLRVQAQVEHIRDSVRKRRRQAGSVPADDGSLSWDQKLWGTFVTTLTTSPKGEEEHPLIVQEELAYHPLLQNISREAAVEIEAHPETYPGMRIERTTRRDYPQGAVASHVIGYRTRLSEERIQQRRAQLVHADPLNYQVGDWMGQTGVEKFYESDLRGLRGRKKLTTNLRGEIVREEIVRQPRAGQDLELSIHVPLQLKAEELLERTLRGLPLVEGVESERGKPAGDAKGETLPAGGVLAVMDIRTGELVAAASAPHFDLRALTDARYGSWPEITSDPRHPLFPRLTRMQLPAGSVFKTVTAVALMHEEGFNPDRGYHCQGFLKTPDRFRCLVFTHSGVGHYETDLAKALAQSCNVYFFKLAPKVGGSRLADWGRNFGFGERTGIDLPGEERGFLPAHQVGVTQQRGRNDPLGLAIGQSTLLVTPIQVLRMMAAVANGGTLVTPHFLRGSGPTSVADATSRKTSRVPVPGLDPQRLARVREGLEQVVSHPQGTGYKTVRLSEIKIAGKTGTAEVAGRPDHAWFAGYFPADRPRYAVVSVLEHGGSGGKAAGPLAREMVRAMLDQGMLRPERRSPAAPVTADVEP